MSWGKTKTSSTSNQTATTSGTQTQNPWDAVIPAITGSGGLLDAAKSTYNAGASSSDALKAALAQQAAAIQARGGNAGAVAAAGQGLLATPQTPAQQVKGQYIQSAPQVSVPGAFGALGEIDPTQAYKGLLSGDVTNSYIDKQLAANTEGAKSAYQQMLDDSNTGLTRDVLPVIRSGANLSGQYGGSREGIAEGVAIGDAAKQQALSGQTLAANLAKTNADTLSGAYEGAQGRQLSAAQGLGGLAIDTATGNANRALDVIKTNVATDADLNKFNSGITLANNAQQVDATKAGAGLLGDAAGMSNADLDALIKSLTSGQAYDQSNLGVYGGLLGNLAGLGGTTNTTGTANTTGSTTGKQTTLGFDVNDAIKAGTALAALSDARLKREVETVGYDAKGRRVVDFAYLWSAPGTKHRGHIAQEILRSDPHAVTVHPSGYLMVDYAKLEAA